MADLLFEIRTGMNDRAGVVPGAQERRPGQAGPGQAQAKCQVSLLRLIGGAAGPPAAVPGGKQAQPGRVQPDDPERGRQACGRGL